MNDGHGGNPTRRDFNPPGSNHRPGLVGEFHRQQAQAGCFGGGLMAGPLAEEQPGLRLFGKGKNPRRASWPEAAAGKGCDFLRLVHRLQVNADLTAGCDGQQGLTVGMAQVESQVGWISRWTQPGLFTGRGKNGDVSRTASEIPCEDLSQGNVGQGESFARLVITDTVHPALLVAV